MRPILLAIMLLAAAACGHRTDNDQLAVGRTNLKSIHGKCGDTPAVAGVVGVNGDPKQVYLQDWILVSVCHLETLLDKQPAQPVHLFIEGIDAGIAPSGIDRETGTLTFILDRNDKNKDLWQPLLYGPLADPTTSVRVSVGMKDDKPVPAAPGAELTLHLEKLITSWYTGVGSIVVLAAFIVIFLGWKTDLLRDGPTVGGVQQALSLARSQMAWWFILILAGYTFIWLVTGDRDTIPPSLLGLMGISAATALTAVAIASRGASQSSMRKTLLDAELVAIEKALAELATLISDPTMQRVKRKLEEKRDELEVRRERVLLEGAGLTTLLPKTVWWKDLLTDDSGAIGLDRLQIIVWTLVLGVIFLTSVLWDLTMPEFNTTLLALMGISAGTYIGFKLPGK
jgi:hypothetical protein